MVSEIGPPFAGNVNETTRELRVWPERELPIVLNFACSAQIHSCPGSPAVIPSVHRPQSRLPVGLGPYDPDGPASSPVLDR